VHGNCRLQECANKNCTQCARTNVADLPSSASVYSAESSCGIEMLRLTVPKGPACGQHQVASAAHAPIACGIDMHQGSLPSWHAPCRHASFVLTAGAARHQSDGSRVLQVNVKGATVYATACLHQWLMPPNAQAAMCATRCPCRSRCHWDVLAGSPGRHAAGASIPSTRLLLQVRLWCGVDLQQCLAGRSMPAAVTGNCVARSQSVEHQQYRWPGCS